MSLHPALRLQQFLKHPHPISIEHLLDITISNPALNQRPRDIAGVGVVDQIWREENVKRRQGHVGTLVEDELDEVKAEPHAVETRQSATYSS